ncbi:MAG: DUF4012 domain-containing protein [Anaerolineales bacterium]|jgi:hypothetical protein|nr:DUF4012 domain-containing protein [Anaerolineales bacterium]
MGSDIQQIEALKFILENALSPGNLDDHPWAGSLLVQEVPDAAASPGQRLVTAIARLFAESMPAVPPRQGKRLDTRWAEFGLLAAQYFAPILYGLPLPASLREAWGRIDESILLFVGEKPETELSEQKKKGYRLLAREAEIAPHSTLSDWHRKGLLRLLQAILAREAYLAKSLSKPALIVPDGSELRGPISKEKRRNTQPKIWARLFLFAVSALLLGLLLAGGWKARQIYQKAIALRQNAAELQSLLSSSAPLMERARQAGPALSVFRAGFLDLKAEVEPFMGLTPILNWLPQYGPELTASQDLLNYGDSLLGAVDLLAQAASPFLQEDLQHMPPDRLPGLLIQSEPQLMQSQAYLEAALLSRAKLQPERFSERVRNLILDDLDPLTALMQDGLSLALELPRALGASPEGPKTYLLLVQNEDELRPTGGFITAAGTVLVQEGHIANPVFVNSGYLDDWSKPYPVAPWQLSRYMNSPVLIFRDTTWFTNYPTTALYAEQLYAYVNAHSVDGVFAFDQQFLIKLLRLTGPLKLPGEPMPVSAENATQFMREAKEPDPQDLGNAEWDNKQFLNDLGTALLSKILSGDVSWELLAETLIDAMDERTLLVQLDNPVLADYLARRGWDGAVRPLQADFLLVADANIGYNKTNAVVETNLEYEIDLRAMLSPTAVLSVTHTNNAAEMFTCAQWAKNRVESERAYPITDCYWNYMRVYRPAGTELLDSVSQFIPANWMLTYNSVPPQVDELGNEDIAGVQAYGTLKVIPGGHSETTIMRFGLPLNVFQMQPQDGLVAYRLRVQKQPGTTNIPLQLRVYLGPGAAIYWVPDGAAIEGNTISYETKLRTDLEFEILFFSP